jgi:prevent-host-death family protein
MTYIRLVADQSIQISKIHTMDIAPDFTIGAYDARTHFSELLARVEKGDEITITRHGTPIACLVPIQRRSTPEQRRAAIDAMRQMATQHSLKGLTIRSLVAEGRR